MTMQTVSQRGRTLVVATACWGVATVSRAVLCQLFKKERIELWWWVELAGMCVRGRSLRVKGG